MSEENLSAGFREISGRKVVVVMFLFAIVVTGALYIYWKLHMAPFLPLQRQLDAAFEDSKPQVEGGQSKMNQGTPRVLRVTMKVPFDPVNEDVRLKLWTEQVQQVIRDWPRFSNFDVLTIHSYHPLPEDEVRTVKQEWKVSELVSE